MALNDSPKHTPGALTKKLEETTSTLANLLLDTNLGSQSQRDTPHSIVCPFYHHPSLNNESPHVCTSEPNSHSHPSPLLDDLLDESLVSIPKEPQTPAASIELEQVLEANGIVNDYYWNLISWSSSNVIAVAVKKDVQLRRLEDGGMFSIRKDQSSSVSSVDFSNDGNVLAAGLDGGDGAGTVEMYDIETQSLLRKIQGCRSPATSLSWNKQIVTVGHYNGRIVHYDVRLGKPQVMELRGHNRIVCGLEWRSDGGLLTSGCDGGVVNIWDSRSGTFVPGSRGEVLWTKRDHNAAVKALAWCPWKPSLLASGGGLSDGTIQFWDTNTGERLNKLDFSSSAQVTSVQWSTHRTEFLTTFGHPNHGIVVHGYPSLEQLVEKQDAHDQRILWSALSPSKDVICTGGADGVLKLWKVWPTGG
ncbi:hypothetical protein NLI96_g6372 [Meripilus lineatus]|uniref:CDC20/Fizzy WD40 domain-containing protein n=1 Tax=Meripilus lineatus TaxID=2056292 RepID=A0AAD5V108_9APHY|nr:hypothetical protein NLI96_g6372 [Physisporinus lineatus]